MSAFILDASYTLAWCFPDRATANTDATLKRLETREDNAIVPWVWQLEVGNALGKAVTRAKVPLARGLQYANKQIVFRIIESLKPWTQVYIDKEDAVRVAQAMDVGHARSLARHAHAFKEEENPVDRKAMSVATCSENMLRGYLAGLGTKTAHPLSESTSRGGPVDGEATFQAESWPWINCPASIDLHRIGPRRELPSRVGIVLRRMLAEPGMWESGTYTAAARSCRAKPNGSGHCLSPKANSIKLLRALTLFTKLVIIFQI